MHVRLLEHYEAVDLFVVVEAPFTFTGNPKPLHFGEALCRRFERFADKIVHVVADFPDAVWKAQEIELYNRGTNDAWRREFAMRVRRAARRTPLPVACQAPIASGSQPTRARAPPPPPPPVGRMHFTQWGRCWGCSHTTWCCRPTWTRSPRLAGCGRPARCFGAAWVGPTPACGCRQ